MSDPSEPRQPPRPPRFEPPDHTSEYPPTSQFPPVGQDPYPPQYAPPQYPPPQYGPPAHEQAPAYAPPAYQQAPQQYGPPGHEPPPPGYGPPQRPPRKSSAPLIAVILAVTLLLCGGVAVVGKILVDRTTAKVEEIAEPLRDPNLPALPSDIPDFPGLPTGFPDLGLPTDLPTDLPGLGEGAEISVTYEVTGDGPAEIVYVEDGSSPKRVGSVTLPWKVSAKMNGPALVSVVAVRTGLDSGSITCRATVDGEQVAEQTADGTLATANCYKFVLG